MPADEQTVERLVEFAENLPEEVQFPGPDGVKRSLVRADLLEALSDLGGLREAVLELQEDAKDDTIEILASSLRAIEAGEMSVDQFLGQCYEIAFGGTETDPELIEVVHETMRAFMPDVPVERAVQVLDAIQAHLGNVAPAVQDEVEDHLEHRKITPVSAPVGEGARFMVDGPTNANPKVPDIDVAEVLGIPRDSNSPMGRFDRGNLNA